MEIEAQDAVDTKVGFSGVDMAWDWCDSQLLSGATVDIKVGKPQPQSGFPSFMSVPHIRCPLDVHMDMKVGFV